MAGVGDTRCLSIGLPLPPVTVAGVSVVLGRVAGVGVVTISAEGVSGVSGVLVVSVSGVLLRIRYGYRVSPNQGEGVTISAEGVAGVSVSGGVLVVSVVFTTQCEGVAGVGDTRCRCFLLGVLNSLKLLTTHSVCGVRVIVLAAPALTSTVMIPANSKELIALRTVAGDIPHVSANS